jgi:AcrR family transcriptional regulator
MGLDSTSDRIVSVATAIMLADGVKKMSLADVAFKSGVTRVTVYRYFHDKQGVIRAVCLHIAGYFQKAAEAASPQDSMQDIEFRLNRLGEDLRAMPPGNLLARINEIGRLYPEVHWEFHAARQEAIDKMFEQQIAAAEREQSLHPGLNLQVVRAIFDASVIGLLENPALISSNVTLSELFATVTQVFRYGIVRVKEAANNRE